MTYCYNMKYILAAKERMLVTNSSFTFMIVNRNEISVIYYPKLRKSNNTRTRILEFSNIFADFLYQT